MRAIAAARASALALRVCLAGGALMMSGVTACLAQLAPPQGYGGFDRIIPPVLPPGGAGPSYQAPLPPMPPFNQYYVPRRHGHGAQLIPYSSGLTYDPFAPVLPGYSAPDGTYDPYGGYYYGQPYPLLQPPARPSTTAPTQPPSTRYYVHAGTEAFAEHPDLGRAVADIEKAFRTGDAAVLEKHLPAHGDIRLRNVDGSTRPVAASAYLSATRSALSAMHTVGYQLTGVEATGRSGWRVVGTHAIRGADAVTRTYAVGFLLRKAHGQWTIEEVAGELVAAQSP